MIDTNKTYIYHSFGLNIVSDIALPELECLEKFNSQIDVTIEKSRSK